MVEYLNMPIKEVINKFPKVGDILNEYNIGCVPCSVGSCLLKDIVEIHNLSVKGEEKLLSGIAAVIYPGKDVKIPKLKRKQQAKSNELKYSPPIKKLVDEHVYIKKVIAAIPGIIKNLNLKTKEGRPPSGGRQFVLDAVDFIRSYADKFHHAKEEDILFKYFDEKLDIVHVMLEDHTTGRNHIKAVLKAMDEHDKNAVIEHLNGYRDLLTQHIKKEDEILYTWMDRNLTMAQIGEMFSKFNDVEEKMGKSVPIKYEKFADSINEVVKRRR